MNKAICWEKENDEHFTGSGTEYQCGEAYCICKADGTGWRAVVGVYCNCGEIITVDINDQDFVFIFRNGYDENVIR